MSIGNQYHINLPIEARQELDLSKVVLFKK